MCGEQKVNVAHFMLFSVLLAGGGSVILCCVHRFIFCSAVIGKLLAVAIRSMVFHSLSWRVWLSGILNVLSM
jgi:hypothetical protein